MVSTRKFFSITIMMAVILFMFQFTLVIKDKTNEYEVNEHIVETGLTQETMWQQDTAASGNGRNIVLIGNSDSGVRKNAEQWCSYSKRSIQVYHSLSAYREEQEELPQAVLLESSCVDYDEDMDILYDLTKQGVTVIFCNLPEPDVIRANEKLRTFLGIASVQANEVQLNGVKLFSGFLLGGESIYQAKTASEEQNQDLELAIPWYYTATGTKTYMVGLMEDKTVKNEELPAIIWRNSLDGAFVFAVNGSYMSDIMEIGILEAMITETQAYNIYPIVNAQNFVISNYPGLAAENEEQMMEIYSRTQDSVFRDVVWPGMIAINEKNNFNLTFLLTPQVDYLDLEEPSDEELIMYLKQLKEQDAEVGLSMEYSRTTTTLQVKVNRDCIFFRNTGITYIFRAAAVAPDDLEDLLTMTDKVVMKNVRTITCTYTSEYPLLTYCADDITLQCSNSDGVTHTYTDDLRLKSLETALGYSTIQLDMNNVAWPETTDDRWENFYRGFSSNVDTYWKPFQKFNMTTLSESDANVRRFLAMDYAVSEEENGIRVDLTGVDGDCWFLLRMAAGTPGEITGGTFEEVEDGVYLIHAEQASVQIQWEDSEDLYYYLP